MRIKKRNKEEAWYICNFIITMMLTTIIQQNCRNVNDWKIQSCIKLSHREEKIQNIIYSHWSIYAKFCEKSLLFSYLSV